MQVAGAAAGLVHADHATPSAGVAAAVELAQKLVVRGCSFVVVLVLVLVMLVVVVRGENFVVDVDVWRGVVLCEAGAFTVGNRGVFVVVVCGDGGCVV